MKPYFSRNIVYVKLAFAVIAFACIILGNVTHSTGKAYSDEKNTLDKEQPVGMGMEELKKKSNEYCYGAHIHRDYNKLKFLLRSNKQVYKTGEPVFVRFYVYNDSDKQIDMKTDCSKYWRFQPVESDKIQRTQLGIHREELRETPEYSSVYEDFFVFGVFKLAPREIQEISEKPLIINHWFDMTLPGKYQFFCAPTDIITIGTTYLTPMRSNDLTIQVVSDLYGSEMVEQGDYNNPPLNELTTEKTGE